MSDTLVLATAITLIRFKNRLRIQDMGFRAPPSVQGRTCGRCGK